MLNHLGSKVIQNGRQFPKVGKGSYSILRLYLHTVNMHPQPPGPGCLGSWAEPDPRSEQGLPREVVQHVYLEGG